MFRKLLPALVVVGTFIPSLVSAAEPGWYGKVRTTGAFGAQIEATPILNRPYRPFHFYGNAVRRRHYRGTAMPNLSDIRFSTSVLLRRQGI